MDKVVLHSGTWLRLVSLEWTDASGKKRAWESAERCNCRGAAAVVAVMRPSLRVLLVRQFRPPAGRHVVEFPAGLLDHGESPEAAAVRELFEETGYAGRVVAATAPAFSSAGMTDEANTLVWVEIPEEAPENAAPCQHLDPGEEIEVLKVPLRQLPSFLERCRQAGDGVDVKLATAALVISMLGVMDGVGVDLAVGGGQAASVPRAQPAART